MLQIAVAQAPKDSWLSKANMTSTREGLTVTAVDGKIFAIDGFGIVGNVFVGDTNANEMYDPATDSWTTKTSAPTVRAELTAAAHGGKIFVLGGRNIGVLNTNEIYDVAADAWSKGAPRPFGAANVLGTVEAYDIATDTWTTITPLNVARSDLIWLQM